MEPNQVPQPNMGSESQGERSYGAIIGIILIILVLIVGALYFWGLTLERGTMQASDEIEAIESDLNSEEFSIESIDAELENLEAELNF